MALRILVVLLILAVPLELPGCGPFLPEAQFYLAGEPESVDVFAHGQLGILQPSYARLYQVIAYRYLAGIGLNDAEVRAISPEGPPAVDSPVPIDQSNPWLTVRNSVPGIAPLKQIDSYRQVKKEGFFDSYLNCNDDAFRTAASTLERVRGTPAAADWVAAQDIVFSDCSKGSAIPQPTSDPQLRPDRAYQIASAKFYSEQYDAAREDFESIAADSSSPWRGIAPYLAARCLIRAGRFADAGKELERIAGDPALSRWHAAAEGMLNYVRTRIDPPGRMHELALALVRKDSEATIGQDLIDYRLLWDHNVQPSGEDDLTDWIGSFQAGGFGALEKWRALHTGPWLVAALQAARPNDAALPELLAAAAEVKPDSPAYLTVNYHRARLLPVDEARALADGILAGKLPTASRNQFRGERLGMARDFEEFLRYAARTPVDPDAKPGHDELDSDSALILDQAVPLALLRQAAASPLLPGETRGGLQRVVAMRTLLLSRSPDFAAVFRLLHTPGDSPIVQEGYGRFTDSPQKLDLFGDNWWCAGPSFQRWAPPDQKAAAPPVAKFLPAADRELAATEWRKLAALPAAPDWLGAQTLAFAKQHPEDPRVPEALHLVVRATRYGCTGAQNGDFSKRAFDLLHGRYPDSEWTKKTPYWFK